MSAGERHELSDLLDAASQRVNRLEAANVNHGNKEASLKDKVGPARYCSMYVAACDTFHFEGGGYDVFPAQEHTCYVANEPATKCCMYAHLLLQLCQRH